MSALVRMSLWFIIPLSPFGKLDFLRLLHLSGLPLLFTQPLFLFNFWFLKRQLFWVGVDFRLPAPFCPKALRFLDVFPY